MHQPLAGVLEGELAPLGELLGDPLDPERRDAGEQAAGAAGHREVGDVAEVAVELRRHALLLRGRRRALSPELPGDSLLIRSRAVSGGVHVVARLDRNGRPAGQGPDHPERGQVDPDRSQAGAAQCLRSAPRACRAGPPPRPRRSGARRSRRSHGRRPASPAPPARAASGCGPGPGSGSPSRARRGPRSAAAASVRTATRWLARPTRTVFESLCLENSSLSESPSASGSETSPSLNVPAPREAMPNLLTAESPFGPTSVAATLPASTSRPTTALFLVVESILAQVRKRGTPPGSQSANPAIP